MKGLYRGLKPAATPGQDGEEGQRRQFRMGCGGDSWNDEWVRVRIWTEIDEERLAGNFAVIQGVMARANGAPGDGGTAGATALLAVVKANAYGHGIEPCARVLASAGAEWLGVTDAEEGARVRALLGGVRFRGAGQPQVLVMSGTAGLPGEAEGMVREHLTPVVWTVEHLERIAEAARASGRAEPVAVHVEVDSGMSRQGVRVGRKLASLIEIANSLPGVRVAGVLTHFASTEVVRAPQTARQRVQFEQAMAQILDRGVKLDWVHVGNSSFLDNEDGEGGLAWLRRVAATAGARPMVRSGLALYGHVLPIEGPGVAAARGRVKPVMSWKTRVLAVSEAEPGALVGYNGTYRAERAMRLAVLPVGYADGLRRELSSTQEVAGGWVRVRGQKAPIVGRVSMNLTTVDVSGIAGVAAGDEVVLLGEGITAEDHARLAGTIAYEVLCGVRGAYKARPC